MNIEDFLNQRAEAVMVTEVITLHQDDTVARAADQFLKNQISGAPVLDDTGTCVGVVSVTDLVAAAEKVAMQKAAIADAFFAQTDLLLAPSVYQDQLSRVRDAPTSVTEKPMKDVMVTNVVSVKAETPLHEVLRDFLDAKIHRVIVNDAQDKLAGLITTVDVIAALVRHSAAASSAAK